MQQLELFNEKKEQLIKVFDINKNTKIAYIISSILTVLNRWENIRIYIYNSSEVGKNE